MKKFLLISALVLVILIIIIAVSLFWYYNYLKRTYPKSADLQKLVTLSFSIPSNIPQEEAVLMQDNTPLFITLNYKNTIVRETGLKIKNESIQWICSDGELGKNSGSGANEWYPPEDKSTTAIITAQFSGEYYTPLCEKLFGTIKVEKQISIKIISPIPSAFIDEQGYIDDYRIGIYLNPFDENDLKKFTSSSHNPRLHPDKYLKPKFYYKVTEENKNLLISPHFKLGDYAMDYPWFSLGIPQYIALDYKLIRKLEELRNLMNEDGFNIDKFTIIYGFRSPAYNRDSIANDGSEFTLKEIWSMHQYGKALDFIIDKDGDLVIDDLNQDGKIDMQDPAVIMHYVNILDRKYREEENLDMVGGAGLYPHHDFWERKQSPYIHIDVRGFLDQQGKLIRWPLKWEDGTIIIWGQI